MCNCEHTCESYSRYGSLRTLCGAEPGRRGLYADTETPEHLLDSTFTTYIRHRMRRSGQKRCFTGPERSGVSPDSDSCYAACGFNLGVSQHCGGYCDVQQGDESFHTQHLHLYFELKCGKYFWDSYL